MIKTIKTTMYIIVDKHGTGDISTLNYWRKECIKNFLEGSTITWDKAKKNGWKCEKVDVNIMSSLNY